MGQIVHHLLFNRCCWIPLSRVCTNFHALQQCVRMLASPGLLSQHTHRLFLSVHGTHGLSFLIVVEVYISPEITEATEDALSHLSLSNLFLSAYLRH